VKDLAGNVGEWTTSRDGNGRFRRGGDWFSSEANDVRASYRPDPESFDTPNLLGFRCARSP
jgi:formylglycine-generating enzyme required for sulfatase activity